MKTRTSKESRKSISAFIDFRFAWLALLVICCTMTVGCGDDGKYTVSGTVTFQGKPIPAGEIRFTPDKGNTGPIVLARIKDGEYSTPEDKGLLGGAYQLRITGFGPAVESKDESAPDFGKSLFSTYREDVEFPKEDFEHNIDIKTK